VNVTRPNGKVYRPRKEPYVEVYESDYLGESQIMVTRLGPDSEEEARKLAEPEFKRHGFELMGSGYFGWWRSSIRNNETEWVYDSERGVPGWVFRVE